MNDEDLDRHIQLIYSTVSAPSNWQFCLSDIAQTLNAKSGMIGLDNLSTGSNVEALRVGFSDDMLSAFAPLKELDLWTHALSERPPEAIYTSSELVRQKDYLNSEMFHGFGKYADIYHTIGVHVGAKNGHANRVGFQRSQSQGEYGAQEKRYLNRLLPHIRRALNLTEEIFQNSLSAHANEQIMERLNYAAFLLNTAGKIVQINRVAQDLIDANNLLAVREGYLRAIKGVSSNDLGSAIAEVSSSQGLQRSRHSIPFLAYCDVAGVKNRYLVEVSRFQADLNSNFSLILNLDAPQLVKLTVRPLFQPRGLEDRLSGLFSLSKTEVQVCILLVEGLSPADIASKRARSLDTVRTQIKQILSKTGMKRTSELIAFISKLP